MINGASCDAADTSGCATRPPKVPGPGYAPNGIALDPTNHVLYTANFYGASVSAIDVASAGGSAERSTVCRKQLSGGPRRRHCKPHRLRLEQSRWDRLGGGQVDSALHQGRLESGRRDSNPRPSPWQGDALPLRHFRVGHHNTALGAPRWEGARQALQPFDREPEARRSPAVYPLLRSLNCGRCARTRDRHPQPFLRCQVADEYNRLRSGPSDEALDWLIPDEGDRCPRDRSRYRHPHAAARRSGRSRDSRRARRAHARRAEPPVTLESRSLAGQAEEIPAATSSVDVVIAQSAWHWVDEERAVPEVARVLRPGGRLSLVWTGPDRSVDWMRSLWAGGIIFSPEDVPTKTIAGSAGISSMSIWRSESVPPERDRRLPVDTADGQGGRGGALGDLQRRDHHG